MFINLDGVIMNDEYIGYAYVFKKEIEKTNKWILHIRFANDNQHGDYIELKYKTKKEAEDKLKELEDKLIKKED